MARFSRSLTSALSWAIEKRAALTDFIAWLGDKQISRRLGAPERVAVSRQGTPYRATDGTNFVTTLTAKGVQSHIGMHGWTQQAHEDQLLGQVRVNLNEQFVLADDFAAPILVVDGLQLRELLAGKVGESLDVKALCSGHPAQRCLIGVGPAKAVPSFQPQRKTTALR